VRRKIGGILMLEPCVYGGGDEEEDEA